MKNSSPFEPAFKLDFYLSQPHDCGYFPNRRAMSLFADPDHPQSAEAYSRLIALGFRRSGRTVYRPQCFGCHACVPFRVDAQHFRPNRSQLRALRRNQDVTVERKVAEFREEHFELYTRYIAARHPGGGMDNPTREDFARFLCQSIPHTHCYEFRSQGRLLAVAVVDHFDDAFSAVYTYYDPSESQRSLGTFAVLWELAEVQRLGKRWLYLGYWIEDCAKMVYKQAFQPAETLVEGQWQAFQRD